MLEKNINYDDCTGELHMFESQNYNYKLCAFIMHNYCYIMQHGSPLTHSGYQPLIAVHIVIGVYVWMAINEGDGNEKTPLKEDQDRNIQNWYRNGIKPATRKTLSKMGLKMAQNLLGGSKYTPNHSIGRISPSNIKHLPLPLMRCMSIATYHKHSDYNALKASGSGRSVCQLFRVDFQFRIFQNQA